MEEKKIINEEVKESLDNKDNIVLTSINSEAIKKISNKKVSLQEKAINALLATLILGGAAFGGYKYYEYQKALDIEISQIPTIEEIMEDQTGTIIFDGEEINIEDLKEQYGLAYYFYEPLTDEQINEQFRGIMKHTTEMLNKSIDVDESIGVCDQYGFFIIWKHDYEIMKALQKADIEYLKPVLLENAQYQKYFNAGNPIKDYTDGFQYGYMDIASYLNSLLEQSSPSYNVDSLSMEVKSFYVKYWKYSMSAIKQAIKDYNLEKEYEEYNPDLFFEEDISYQPVIKIYI